MHMPHSLTLFLSNGEAKSAFFPERTISSPFPLPIKHLSAEMRLKVLSFPHGIPLPLCAMRDAGKLVSYVNEFPPFFLFFFFFFFFPKCVPSLAIVDKKTFLPSADTLLKISPSSFSPLFSGNDLFLSRRTSSPFGHQIKRHPILHTRPKPACLFRHDASVSFGQREILQRTTPLSKWCSPSTGKIS